MNAGVGGSFNDGFGVSGGVAVGNPFNSQILVPVIMGLGLLSLFNIVLTIITPLFNKPAEEEEEGEEDARRMGRGVTLAEMTQIADKVYQAVQKYQEMQ